MSLRKRRQAQRRQRSRKRWGVPAFNLVSLMDIFTILVFFLLVNSGEMQDVPSTRDVHLPTSYSDLEPEKTVTVVVTAEDIRLEGVSVVSLDALDAGTPALLAALKSARESSSSTSGEGRITVIGDRNTAYATLKRVMQSCTEAGFSRISLAVSQTGKTG